MVYASNAQPQHYINMPYENCLLSYQICRVVEHRLGLARVFRVSVEDCIVLECDQLVQIQQNTKSKIYTPNILGFKNMPQLGI